MASGATWRDWPLLERRLLLPAHNLIAKWERGEESSYFKYKSSEQPELIDIDSSALVESQIGILMN